MENNKMNPKEIEEYIEQALKDWGVPGGSAMIWKDGEMVSCRGYGVRELGKPDLMDENTIFHIASSTKAFTATLLGMLVDDGKLNWDDKVVKFLPEFKMYDPWITNELTLRDLLNHRLGLKRYNRVMFRNHPFDPDEFLSHFPYMEPFAGFRTRFGYGNEQYIAAGKVIEVVTGKRYEDFLQERILTPLGMTFTYPTLERLQKAGVTNLSHGHCNLDGGYVPNGVRLFDPVQALPLVDIGKNAAGCIWSSTKDMARWLEFFLGNGTFEGKSLVSAAQMEEMRTPQFAIAPRDEDLSSVFAVGVNINIMTYAFGWYVMDYQGRKLVVHGGNIHNGNNVLGFVPQENLAFLLFVNNYQAIIQVLLSFFMVDAMLGAPRKDYCRDGIAMAKMWQAGAEQQVGQIVAGRKTDTKPSLPLAGYTGTYASPLLGEMQISLENDRLVHKYGSSGYYDADLKHWENETFVVDYRIKFQNPEFITFKPGEDGKAAALVLVDDGFEMVGQLERMR